MSTTTQTRTGTREKQVAKKSQGFSLESLRGRLEDHVKSHPLKAVGQAMAAGYILRFLPLRQLLATGIRLAAPMALLNQLWKNTHRNPEDES